jgi:hypothetical protein
MARWNLFVGLAARLIAGASIAVFSGGHGAQRALGQEPAGVSSGPGRYQVSAWAYPTPGGGGTYGAFVLNTQTGQLWEYTGTSGLKKSVKLE